MLEVTMTHRFDSKGTDRLKRSEAEELRRNRWIGLGAEGYGPDPLRYPPGQHRQQIGLFNRIAHEGAAVVASYPGLELGCNHLRIVGVVQPQPIEYLGRLIRLTLSTPRVFDASACFLGNLPATRCTIQKCSERSKGRLELLAMDKPIPVGDTGHLHHRDVEWLCLNYLICTKQCETIWNGGQAYAGIDAVGWSHSGGEILAQVTVSRERSAVLDKVRSLQGFGRPDREIVFFAPQEVRHLCPGPVAFIALEQVFTELGATRAGKRLIDRSFSAEPIDPSPF